jgi:REP element-mobilizing transposase RayT
MALWRLYYHLIWATKNRLPLITSDIEPKIYDYMIGKADSINCITHAIGGIENHIHIVASIPPKLSIMVFVQSLKGSSSHHINHQIKNNHTTFGWQRGYGVFSLGENKLDIAINYVINQKQHHSEGTLITLLEKDSEEDDAPTKCVLTNR